MAFICQNCGVTTEDKKTLCNPIDEENNSKLCSKQLGSTQVSNVCRENALAVEYSCTCGNVSANSQYLCHPTRM